MPVGRVKNLVSIFENKGSKFGDSKDVFDPGSNRSKSIEKKDDGNTVPASPSYSKAVPMNADIDSHVSVRTRVSNFQKLTGAPNQNLNEASKKIEARSGAVVRNLTKHIDAPILDASNPPKRVTAGDVKVAQKPAPSAQSSLDKKSLPQVPSKVKEAITSLQTGAKPAESSKTNLVKPKREAPKFQRFVEKTTCKRVEMKVEAYSGVLTLKNKFEALQSEENEKTSLDKPGDEDTVAREYIISDFLKTPASSQKSGQTSTSDSKDSGRDTDQGNKDESACVVTKMPLDNDFLSAPYSHAQPAEQEAVESSEEEKEDYHRTTEEPEYKGYDFTFLDYLYQNPEISETPGDDDEDDEYDDYRQDDGVSQLPEGYKVMSPVDGRKLSLILPPPPSKSILKKAHTKSNKKLQFKEEISNEAETYNMYEYSRSDDTVDVQASSLEHDFERSFSEYKQLEVLVERDPNERLGLQIYGKGLREQGASDHLAIYVKSITPNSPCDRCGNIKPDDLIIRINGVNLLSTTVSAVHEVIKSGRNSFAILLGRREDTEDEERITKH